MPINARVGRINIATASTLAHALSLFIYLSISPSPYYSWYFMAN